MRIIKNPGMSDLVRAIKQAQHALIVIWFMGIASISVAAVYIFQPSAEVSRKLNQFNAREKGGMVQSIDELLLSPDEALLDDRKAFVNGTLRFQQREPDLSDDNNRNMLYNNILKKKLQRLPASASTDFSIRPIPK